MASNISVAITVDNKQYIANIKAADSATQKFATDTERSLNKAGGSFDKKDMMKALLHFDIDEDYFNYLIEKRDELLKPKNIPKPFDDINDSLLLCLVGQNHYKSK